MSTPAGPSRVLVTGGSGFLGAEICRMLIARGTETHSFSRHPSAAPTRLGVRQHNGDLADPAALSRAVAGCDAVIHCADTSPLSSTMTRPGEAGRQPLSGVRSQCRCAPRDSATARRKSSLTASAVTTP
ncbi:NAD-dependent epimerase/dehydratase family protein [Streptomyces syringium]|uniref:NAD-dependent epimerase/dehydratase family protein n=1 Tax=Streptomyces syringium TaxID=76729 RepID=UPI00343B0C24